MRGETSWRSIAVKDVLQDLSMNLYGIQSQAVFIYGIFFEWLKIMRDSLKPINSMIVFAEKIHNHKMNVNSTY